MSRRAYESFPSVEGISAIEADPWDASMCNNQDSEYKIKVKTPGGESERDLSQDDPRLDLEPKKTSKNSYHTGTTGYDINRQLFSEDDIREAFEAIDINADGCLTADEISFFLKCMGQHHTPHEVQEMISMVSNDPKKVVLQDFKKVGKGKLSPFAAIRQPQTHANAKQQVLHNLRDSLPSSLHPRALLALHQQPAFARQAYEEERLRRHEERQPKPEGTSEQSGGLRLRTVRQIEEKRAEFVRGVTLNVEQAVEGVKGLRNTGNGESVDPVQLSEVLSLSEDRTRRLFGEEPMLREVVFDLILFSHASNLRKMELLLRNWGEGEPLSLQEWTGLLVFLLGTESRSFLRRRLEGVLRERGCELSARFDRFFIANLMALEGALFRL